MRDIFHLKSAVRPKTGIIRATMDSLGQQGLEWCIVRRLRIQNKPNQIKPNQSNRNQTKPTKPKTPWKSFRASRTHTHWNQQWSFVGWCPSSITGDTQLRQLRQVAWWTSIEIVYLVRKGFSERLFSWVLEDRKVSAPTWNIIGITKFVRLSRNTIRTFFVIHRG